MLLSQFNKLNEHDAATLIRPCVDNDAWVTAVVSGRPYKTVQCAVAQARQIANTWNQSDLDQALSQHPRIGERSEGSTQEAKFSREEQAGTGIDDITSSQLLVGNREYETHFGRVFLIRAAGRTASDILFELQRRLKNSPEAETAEATRELSDIAVLRLEGILEA